MGVTGLVSGFGADSFKPAGQGRPQQWPGKTKI